MYWKTLLTWINGIREIFKTGIMKDLMENSNRQKELVKNAKVIRMIKKVDFSLYPFKLTIRRIAIYDKFDKIAVENKQIKIDLHKK